MFKFKQPSIHITVWTLKHFINPLILLYSGNSPSDMFAEISSYKLFVFFIKYYHAKEFNNQVDKMTHSVDSQPLSPAICDTIQWVHE